MKNFDDFADSFLDTPKLISDASEKLLFEQLTKHIGPELSKGLIQFQKNYSLLLVEEYHKWVNSTE